MTGYAAVTSRQDGFTLTVSLRSVNHRHLDLRTHLPELLLPLEREARGLIQSKNPRGHVDLSASVEFSGGGDLHVDESLAGKYVEVFRRFASQHGLTGPLDAASVLQLPGVITRNGSANSAGSGSSPELEAAFRACLAEAVDLWDGMRAEEAALLVGDMSARVVQIANATEEVERQMHLAVPEAKRLLSERLQALVGQPGLDPARLAQEALLLVDRTDTTEEIQRMKAHVTRFKNLLEKEADAGRKLDFLLQEMQREANTLLAKVAGLGTPGLAITELGLQMKPEIEKLREQVQNLQ